MECFILIAFLFGWFCYCGFFFFSEVGEGVSFCFLMHQLLCTEVKAGTIENCVLHLN